MSKPVYPNCSDFISGEYCYNCGKRLCAKIKCGRKNRCKVGFTKEHIPPKAFFEINKFAKSQNISSIPDIDDITVPSCLRCNNHASINDEYFVRYLIIMSLEGSSVAREINPENLRRWRKNKALSRDFANAPHGIYEIVTRNNIWLAKKHAVTVPDKYKKGFLDCLEKIVKGLYYKHMGRISGKQMRFAWSNVFLELDRNQLKVDFLSDKTIDILRSVFRWGDREREENGFFIKTVTKGLQINNFRYAFIYLKTPEAKEYLFVFLSFYDYSQFLYFFENE